MELLVSKSWNVMVAGDPPLVSCAMVEISDVSPTVGCRVVVFETWQHDDMMMMIRILTREDSESRGKSTQRSYNKYSYFTERYAVRTVLLPGPLSVCCDL